MLPTLHWFVYLPDFQVTPEILNHLWADTGSSFVKIDLRFLILWTWTWKWTLKFYVWSVFHPDTEQHMWATKQPSVDQSRVWVTAKKLRFGTNSVRGWLVKWSLSVLKIIAFSKRNIIYYFTEFILRTQEAQKFKLENHFL